MVSSELIWFLRCGSSAAFILEAQLHQDLLGGKIGVWLLNVFVGEVRVTGCSDCGSGLRNG